MKKIDLYLISDSTGDTVCSVARSAMSQFAGIDVQEHIWPLVRTTGQMDKVLDLIEDHPGPVLYTIVDSELRDQLKARCRSIGVPCVSVLSRIVNELSTYLHLKATPTLVGRHELDDEYFSRVEAISFMISHDDGQATHDLDEADIILVGVSRTSKSPTCVYLAYRGYNAANVPFVPGVPLPSDLLQLKHPMIVGLTIQPDRLLQVRKNRLLSVYEEHNETSYVDQEIVQDEINEARRFFVKQGWPVIDVSRRSVEETAATIIKLYQERKEGGGPGRN